MECAQCNKTYYVTEELHRCPSCEGELEQKPSAAQMKSCPATGKEVRAVGSVPDCSHYRLVNAMGHRCTRGELPGSCKVASLPEYYPRVGTAS